jgi:hypothetical protein
MAFNTKLIYCETKD